MDNEIRRLRLENARLREENAKLREDALFLDSIVENIPNMIFVKGTDELRFIRLNRAGESLLGYSRDELIGRNDHDFFPKEEADFFTSKDREVLAAGGVHVIPEEPIHTSLGLRWLHTMKIPILDEDGQARYLLGISTDITDAKKASQELAAQTEKLSLVLARFPGVVWTASKTNKIQWVAGVYSDLLIEQIGQWQASGATEFRVEERTFEVRAEGLEDGGTMGIALDVTERRRLESEQLQGRLQRGERLQTLGLLAGGIAHDFNNLLASILGNANLATMMLPPDSPVRETIETIEAITETAASLTRQMLAYSGQGRFVITPSDLSSIVEDIVGLLAVSISKRALLTFELAERLPMIEVDVAQIHQLVMNLITNASDALEEQAGQIILRTFAVDADASELTTPGLEEELSPGRYVALEVCDTGRGMDASTCERMFDPFFTTKPTGHGLGMSAALGIVRGHRGAIRVYSESGEGTTITILLPAMGAVAPVEAAPPSPLLPAVLQPRVLVVDDDDAIRVLLEKAFARLGFDGELVDRGEAAVALFAADPDCFDVVIIDMTMPGLSGEETLHALQEINPGVRVLLTSGYSRGEYIRTVPGRVTFLQKPFRLKALADELWSLLRD